MITNSDTVTFFSRKSAAASTMSRKKAKNIFFGEPRELKDYELPTFKDVMRHISWLRLRGPAKRPFMEIANITAERVMKIWEKASIPAISKTTVVKKIQAYHEKVEKIKKSAGRKEYEETVKNFQEESTALFDICTCTCEDPETDCECPAESRVPSLELEFLKDQRNARNMRISSVDRKTTALLKKRNERRNRGASGQKASTSATTPTRQSLNSSFTSEQSSASDVEGSASNTDSDFDPGPTTSAYKAKSQTRLQLPHLASAAYRAGVSLRQAALLASAGLHDYKIQRGK